MTDPVQSREKPLWIGMSAGMNNHIRHDLGLLIPPRMLRNRGFLSRPDGTVVYGFPVYFIVPIDHCPASMNPDIPKPNRLILVIDDDPAQAAFSAKVLIKAGYRVEISTDPLNGEALAQSLDPDLVLMDLYMPKMDGEELTRRLRSHRQFARTPILFLSGEQNDDKQRQVMIAGGDDFVTKPVRPAELVQRVASWISKLAKTPQPSPAAPATAFRVSQPYIQLQTGLQVRRIGPELFQAGPSTNPQPGQQDDWIRQRALDEALIEKADDHLSWMLAVSSHVLKRPSYFKTLKEDVALVPLSNQRLILEFAMIEASKELKAARLIISALQNDGFRVCLGRFIYNATAIKILNFLKPDLICLSDRFVHEELDALRSVVADLHLHQVAILASAEGREDLVELYRAAGVDYVRA